MYSEWVDAAGRCFRNHACLSLLTILDAVAHEGGGAEDLHTSSSRGRLSSGRLGASKGKADAYDDDDDDRGGYEGEDVVADNDDYE